MALNCALTVDALEMSGALGLRFPETMQLWMSMVPLPAICAMPPPEALFAELLVTVVFCIRAVPVNDGKQMAPPLFAETLPVRVQLRIVKPLAPTLPKKQTAPP